MKPILIGIDPGKNGGIAVDNGHGVFCDKMPATDGDIVDYLKEIDEVSDGGFMCRVIVAIEHVGGYAGGPGQPGGAMFNFGDNFGICKGACMMADFKVRLVRPAKWMKDLGMGTRGKRSKTEWKNHLKAEAQRLNPGMKVTLPVADALLILEWLRKQQ